MLTQRYRRVWIREYKGKRGTTYRVCFFDTDAKARQTIRTFHSKREAKAFRDEYQLFLNVEGPKPGSHVEGRVPKRVSIRLWSEVTTNVARHRSDTRQDQSRISFGVEFVCSSSRRIYRRGSD